MVQLASGIQDTPRPTPLTTTVDGHRVEAVRRGARLRIRGLGRPLDERRARLAAASLLDPGERLLDRLIDDPRDLSDRTYTFLVWPRVVSHTRAILAELRGAA